MMKFRFLSIIVVLLFIAVTLVQFKIFKLDKNTIKSEGNGQVKSASTQVNLDDLQSLTLNQLVKFPQKKSDFTELNIGARSYALMDVNSSYLIAEGNSHQSVSIASTTKIMSSIIVLENYNLADTITISQNAATQIGSDIHLKIGSEFYVESLLYALLVQSGNDAAMALAEHMPDGGLDKFVRMMNEKAEYLNLKDTQFKDPAGLNDEGKSSPFDLAIMASYALRNPTFLKIVKTPETTIISLDKKYSHQLKTSNRLVKGDEPLYYPFAFGVKTGFTPLSGHCLVSAAQKDGIQLIGVVLNTYENTVEASAKESRKLLQWGFENFEW